MIRAETLTQPAITRLCILQKQYFSQLKCSSNLSQASVYWTSVQSKHEAAFQVKYCNLSAFEKKIKPKRSKHFDFYNKRM